MDTQNIERYLDSFGRQVVKDAKANLQKAKGDTALGESIRFKVVPTEQGFSTQFYMADYGTFLDKGVSGTKKKKTFEDYSGTRRSSPYKYTTKQPPTGVIDRWVVRKGLKGSRDKEGRFIKRKSMVFLIARSIKRNGIKSLSFFQKPLGLGYEKLQTNLLKELKLDIQTYLTTFYRPK